MHFKVARQKKKTLLLSSSFEFLYEKIYIIIKEVICVEEHFQDKIEKLDKLKSYVAFLARGCCPHFRCEYQRKSKFISYQILRFVLVVFPPRNEKLS